jgi:sec-independent protein translocase protein TatC
VAPSSAKDTQVADFDRDRWLDEHEDPRFGDWDPRPDDELRRRQAIDPDRAPPHSVLRYLERLRRCLIFAAIAIGLGVCLSFYFISEIVAFVMRPMQQLMPLGATLIYMEPSEAFLVYMKVALIAGAALASPVVMLQLWLAIAPPFYAQQKRWGIAFVLVSSILFLSGAAFSHYVVFPLAWRFFVGFTTDTLEFRPQITPALSMYLRLLIAFGIVFQMPTLVLMLTRMRIITAEFLGRNFKYAILIIVIASAVITPDGGGVSMAAMVAPMIVLYALSVGLAWVFRPKVT